MGLLATRWEADWEGVHFTVHRNEVTKGFSLECNGHTLAEKRWSLIGVGELQGTFEHNGQSVSVIAELPLRFRKPTCTIHVDGKEVEVRQTR